MAATLEITDFSRLTDEGDFWQGVHWQDTFDIIEEELSALAAGYSDFDEYLSWQYQD